MSAEIDSCSSVSCHRDALNDIPWTIIFVTIVFIALGIMMLYYLNAKYRVDKSCRLWSKHVKQLEKQQEKENKQEQERGLVQGG